MLFSLPPLPHAWIYRDVFLKNVMFPIINFHSLLSSSYTLFCWGICIMSLNYYPLLTINVFDCVPFEMTISICLFFTLKFSYLTSFLVDSLLSLVILLASSDSSWSVHLFLFKGIVFIGLPVLKSSCWSTFLNMFVFVCYVKINEYRFMIMEIRFRLLRQ